MARIRTIKPEFPQSESMGRVSRDARLLFIMLWTIADDAGRARAASRMLASLLFPYDDDAVVRIPEWLMELEREGCVKVYAIDGNTYLQIEKWDSHQKIDRPSPSRLPPSPPRTKPRERSRKPREESLQVREASSTDLVPSTLDQEGTLDLDLGPNKELRAPQAGAQAQARKPSNDLPDGFEDFWTAYPKKVDRQKALKSYRTALKDTSSAALLAGAKAYADERRREDPTFTKYPATWLNNRCWLNGVASGGDSAAAWTARIRWLEVYAIDGRWPKVDSEGVGPPPHDERTLVTDEDLARVTGARFMRDKLADGMPTPLAQRTQPVKAA